MKKVSFLLTAYILISMMSFAQETKQQIEKLSKDPKTAENAAKADVYVLKNKRVIGDSTKPQACKSNLPRKKKSRSNHKS